MTTDKPTLSRPQRTHTFQTETVTTDWKARHCQAMQRPHKPFECALLEMLRGWESYALAHQSAYESPIHNDGFLGVAWEQIGEGLLGLLNGELNQLDGGTLDRTIRALLEPCPLQDDEDADDEDTQDEDARDDDPASPASEECFLADEEMAILSSYSRADALADGVLVDVTDTAKEAGFRLPVALTQALWADIHAIPERLQGRADPSGRLWDMLFVGRIVVSRQSDAQSSCCYKLDMPVGEATRYTVKICCGPGDNHEPVLTLMLPSED